jgi:hypothetical protein
VSTPRGWAVPGAMVACVSDDWDRRLVKIVTCPVAKTVYTIRDVRPPVCGLSGACVSPAQDAAFLLLEEIRQDPRTCGACGLSLEPAFAVSMFRPVRATDIGDLLALQKPSGGEPVARRERETERIR